MCEMVPLPDSTEPKGTVTAVDTDGNTSTNISQLRRKMAAWSLLQRILHFTSLIDVRLIYNHKWKVLLGLFSQICKCLLVPYLLFSPVYSLGCHTCFWQAVFPPLLFWVLWVWTHRGEHPSLETNSNNNKKERLFFCMNLTLNLFLASSHDWTMVSYRWRITKGLLKASLSQSWQICCHAESNPCLSILSSAG